MFVLERVKAFQDDELKINLNIKSILHRVENFFGKIEIAGQ